MARIAALARQIILDLEIAPVHSEIKILYRYKGQKVIAFQ
jgi:hypothetical protein